MLHAQTLLQGSEEAESHRHCCKAKDKGCLANELVVGCDVCLLLLADPRKKKGQKTKNVLYIEPGIR